MPGIHPPGQVHVTRLFCVGIIGVRRPWSTVSCISRDGIALDSSIPNGYRFYDYYTAALSKLRFDVNTRKAVDVCFSRAKTTLLIKISVLRPGSCLNKLYGNKYIACLSAVGVVTGYGLDDRGVGVRIPVGSRIFGSPRRPDLLWGPPSLLSIGYPR
jgi:hypothetical protein